MHDINHRSKSTLKCLGGTVNRVPQQHGDGHGSDAARHRRNIGRLPARLLEVDVSHEPVAPLGARIVHRIDANVNHRRALLDPGAVHHLSPAARRDNDVRLPADLRPIGRARVDDSHRGILPLEKQSGRHAHDVAPTHDRRLLPGHLHATPLEQLDATFRSARDKRWLPPPHRQAPNVERVEPVNVLLDGDGVQNGLLVDVTRQRQLNQNSMDVRISVIVSHDLQHLLLRGRLWQIGSVRHDAHLLARLLLIANVRL
mmetsp:Transcript_12612/g.36075  ORF Transcript_12612/g.36075 Transcript_12612/m.36075 type:complete len:257 (-) Transcript_12612:343-1113(-)